MNEEEKSPQAKVHPFDRARRAFRNAKAAEKLDNVKARVSDAAEEVGQRYGRVADEVRQRAGRAGESARRGYESTAETVRRGYYRARDDMGGALSDLSDFVRENPARAVGIAAGIGFALGLILRSRGVDDDDE